MYQLRSKMFTATDPGHSHHLLLRTRCQTQHLLRCQSKSDHGPPADRQAALALLRDEVLAPSRCGTSILQIFAMFSPRLTKIFQPTQIGDALLKTTHIYINDLGSSTCSIRSIQSPWCSVLQLARNLCVVWKIPRSCLPLQNGIGKASASGEHGSVWKPLKPIYIYIYIQHI